MPEKFSDWFTSTRKKKKLTQLEAAEKLGLSGPTVSRWENGTEPRAAHLQRLCKWGPISAKRLLQLLAEAA